MIVLDLAAKANETAASRTRELLDSTLSQIFGRLFEHHPVRALGEVLEIARGGSPRPISAFLTDREDGVNWVKIGDATASRKYIHSTKEKIKPSGVSRSRMVYEGDFLLSNSMSFGRPYIMRTVGCIHDGWLVLRDVDKLFDQDYLYYLLGSRMLYEEFSKRAQGSTVQNLNSALVSDVRIPVPPLGEQLRVSAVAHGIEEAVHKLLATYSARLQKIDSLRSSLIQAAFRGEL
jgi:type I restriction enzyme S subunit